MTVIQHKDGSTVVALIEEIERLGLAVERRELGQTAAVQRLVAASGEGLTDRAAQDLILNWRSARSQYETAFDNARTGLTSALNEIWRRS